jgi:hypothetical protein
VPLSLEGFWVLRTEISDKLRTKLTQVPEEQVLEIKRAFFAAARVYAHAGGLSFPSEVLIISGRRGGSRT